MCIFSAAVDVEIRFILLESDRKCYFNVVEFALLMLFTIQTIHCNFSYFASLFHLESTVRNKQQYASLRKRQNRISICNMHHDKHMNESTIKTIEHEVERKT